MWIFSQLYLANAASPDFDPRGKLEARSIN